MRGGAYVLGKRPALDGLRGLAVLAVVVGHARFEGNVGSFGTVGVTLFFVLSGFLITRLLIEEDAERGGVDVRAFLLRRFWRLAPALAVFLVVLAGGELAVGSSPWPVVASAAYVANIAAADGMTMKWLGHMWSLALEEQFYLAWPFALGALVRQRALPWLLGGSIVTVALWRAWLVGHGALLHAARSPDARVDALLVGCLLAVTVGHLPRWVMSAAAGVGVLVLAGAAMAADLELTTWGLLPVELAAAGVVAWAAQSPRFAFGLASAPARGLGRISYSVYLWHYPIAYVTGAAFGPVATGVVTLILSVAIAAASWHFIERPLMLRARARTAASPASEETGLATGAVITAR